MKLRNIGFATIILLLTALSFSSCEDSDRYSWIDAKFERNVETGSDQNGIIRGSFDLDLKYDLYDLRNRPIIGNITDLEYIGGDVLLQLYSKNIPLDFLTLDLVRGGRIVSSLAIRNVPVGESVYEDRYVDNFLYDVHEIIRRDGFARIEYRGQTTYIGVADLDISPLIDTRVYVR